jgi:hypothetical protein
VANLRARVATLEGRIVAADLVGTYRLVGVLTDLDGGVPARVETIAFSGTITLAADGTGSIDVTGNGIELVQGTPWSEAPLLVQDGASSFTWTYSDGTLSIPDLGISLSVGVGGRVLSSAGLSDDNTVDLYILTRLL